VITVSESGEFSPIDGGTSVERIIKKAANGVAREYHSILKVPRFKEYIESLRDWANIGIDIIYGDNPLATNLAMARLEEVLSVTENPLVNGLYHKLCNELFERAPFYI